MADKRLKAVRRLVGVQEQLRRVAEWKLASLNQEASEIDDAKRRTIAALNEEDGLHGLFVDTMARHLGRLGKRAEEVGAAAAIQAEVLRDRTGRAKRAERLAREIGDDQRREEEKAALGEIIEQFGRARRTSLP